MPAKTTRETIARQWELMKMLPTTGAGMTAKELADRLEGAGFKVSKRQIERDLLELEALFPIDCNSAGTPYGWRWAKNASVDIPGISFAEALSIRLVEETLTPLLPIAVQSTLLPRFKQASKKLSALAPRNPHARWADRVRAVPAHMNLIAPVVDQDVLHTAHEALLTERQFETDYQSMESEEAKPFTLHPLGLIARGSVQYLVATAFHFQDPRLYALHRMESATLLADKAKTPDNFCLDDYIEKGTTQFPTKDGKEILLKADIASWLARILSETPLCENQKISRTENGYKISARVMDTRQLRWWILSQGSGIRVTAPISLARDLVEELQTMLSSYKTESS